MAHRGRRRAPKHNGRVYGQAYQGRERLTADRGRESGGASRFFYCAKVRREDAEAADGGPSGIANNHAMRKPISLMRWLIRLATPPGGLIVDPFTGSGTTGLACLAEGRSFVGGDNDAASVRIARRRLRHWQQGRP